MKQPYIGTFYISRVIEPFREVSDVPGLLVNPLREGPGHSPPLFWQPPLKTAFAQLSYSLGSLGHVFAQISLGAFLDPLKVASAVELGNWATTPDTQGFPPHLVVCFGGDSGLAGLRSSVKDSMDVQHWYTCALVTLSLDFGNGHGFATQALVPESTSQFSTESLYDLVPALMNAGHVLDWQTWNRTRGKYSMSFWNSVFDDMAAVTNSPGSEARYPISAIARDDAGLSLMPRQTFL